MPRVSITDQYIRLLTGSEMDLRAFITYFNQFFKTAWSAEQVCTYFFDAFNHKGEIDPSYSNDRVHPHVLTHTSVMSRDLLMQAIIHESILESLQKSHGVSERLKQSIEEDCVDAFKRLPTFLPPKNAFLLLIAKFNSQNKADLLQEARKIDRELQLNDVVQSPSPLQSIKPELTNGIPLQSSDPVFKKRTVYEFGVSSASFIIGALIGFFLGSFIPGFGSIAGCTMGGIFGLTLAAIYLSHFDPEKTSLSKAVSSSNPLELSGQNTYHMVSSLLQTPDHRKASVRIVSPPPTPRFERDNISSSLNCLSIHKQNCTLKSDTSVINSRLPSTLNQS